MAGGTRPIATIALCLTAFALALAATTDATAQAPVDKHGVYRLKSGVVLPYPLDNLFRGFADCRRGRHRHKALDIGGVGPDGGLGTPIRSMARARITAIHTPEDNPKRWGHRLTDKKEVVRGRRTLPASKDIPGYGTVWFFTSDYGTSRTGVIVSTRALDGRLKGNTITYMHLGAAHPDLKVGQTVAAGQEIGLLGGTGVLESSPHLHLSIKTRGGRARDVGPILQIGRTSVRCSYGKRGERRRRDAYTKAGRKLMAALRARSHRTYVHPEPAGCGVWHLEGDFSSGAHREHVISLPAASASREQPWHVTVERTAGKWQPRLQLEDALGGTLYGGSTGSRSDVRANRLKRLANGRRGTSARLRLQPKHGDDLQLRVGRWKKNKAPPRSARYRLTVERPCAAPPSATAEPADEDADEE